MLEDLENNPLPNLELNINSNFGVKPVLIERLIEKANKLVHGKKIKNFKIFTSLDTWGAPAEYIRTGLDLNTWEKNFHTYMTHTKLPLTFMVTFNALTVVNFKGLLKKFLEWRRMYSFSRGDYIHRVRFDTPYLKEPLQYDMNILPKEEFMPFMQDSLKFIEDNLDDKSFSKFTTLEYEKFRRVVDYMETTTYTDEKLKEGRKDFYNWFTEYDRRRGTDFSATFPEMVEFYNRCKDE